MAEAGILDLTQKAYAAVHDLVVDFFGILMPGIAFTVTTLYLLSSLFNILNLAIGSTANALPTCDLSTHGNLFIFIIFGYIVGFIFFRKGPKRADVFSVLTILYGYQKGVPAVDTKSINEVLNERGIDLRNQIVLGVTSLREVTSKNRKKAAAATKNGPHHPIKKLIGWLGLNFIDDMTYYEIKSYIQWPYENLSEYVDRKIPHLANYIHWKPKHSRTPFSEEAGDADTTSHHGQHSKLYINSIKETIRFFFPHKYQPLARQEAHVRLSSSLWYTARATYSITILFNIIGLAATTTALLEAEPPQNIISSFFQFQILCALIATFSYEARIHIQRHIHYQRLREIAGILTTTHNTYTTNKDIWCGYKFPAAKQK